MFAEITGDRPRQPDVARLMSIISDFLLVAATRCKVCVLQVNACC